MKIAVGTTNPVKIEAVRLAFASVWPNESLEVAGTKVESGVSEQPMSYEETILGAQNRAARVLVAVPEADYGVGLEGGLHKIGDKYFIGGWVAVLDKNGQVGLGGSGSVELAPSVLELVLAGDEVGTACDKIFARQNIKQAEGYIGVVTNKILNRTSKFQSATVAALAKFIHPELF